jgi:hypothetical protein
METTERFPPSIKFDSTILAYIAQLDAGGKCSVISMRSHQVWYEI